MSLQQLFAALLQVASRLWKASWWDMWFGGVAAALCCTAPVMQYLESYERAG